MQDPYSGIDEFRSDRILGRIEICELTELHPEVNQMKTAEQVNETLDWIGGELDPGEMANVVRDMDLRAISAILGAMMLFMKLQIRTLASILEHLENE